MSNTNNNSNGPYAIRATHLSYSNYAIIDTRDGHKVAGAMFEWEARQKAERMNELFNALGLNDAVSA